MNARRTAHSVAGNRRSGAKADLAVARRKNDVVPTQGERTLGNPGMPAAAVKYTAIVVLMILALLLTGRSGGG